MQDDRADVVVGGGGAERGAHRVTPDLAPQRRTAGATGADGPANLDERELAGAARAGRCGRRLGRQRSANSSVEPGRVRDRIAAYASSR